MKMIDSCLKYVLKVKMGRELKKGATPERDSIELY
jgi:hypothetical protein